MKAHRSVIAWVTACGATLLLVTPLAAERLIVRTYTVVDGLPSDRIGCLVPDTDGFLWVCTSGGLSRFDGSRFVTYGTAHGLPDPVVNHFLQTRSGTRWVAMNGGGVARLNPAPPGADGRIFEPFDVGSTPRSMRVNILFETRDGALLAGTDGGLFRARHPDATPQFELGPLDRSTPCLASPEAAAALSVLPASASDSVCHWAPGGDRQDASRVRSFHQANDGWIWMASHAGLAALDGARFRLFETWLWVPGRETFFARDPTARHPHFESFRDADGEPLTAFALVDDRDGWVYAQTYTGLLRFRPDNGRVQQLGLGGPFTKLITTFHRDAEGRLWVLRDDGVLRYAPRPLVDRDPPPIRIAGIQTAGAPLPVAPTGVTSLAPLSLDTDQRQLRFDYFGIGFGEDAPLRFQVKLDGVDDEWSRPSSESTVLYGGLGPGRYRLQVRAVSATGRVSAEPATVDFTILPPFWRRAWFLAVVSAILAAAVFAAHRLRMRRVLELERIRTRIAADLHDDLGASLARVSLLSAATRRTLHDSPEHAERMLHEIGTTSRELVTAAGDIAFSIDPGRGRLDGLVARLRRFTEDLLADTGIDWRFTVDGEMADVMLSSDQRRHLLAIVKEALHNAVRHARPRHVSLTLALRGDVLLAELTDDGCGFRTDASGNGGPPQANRNGRGRQTTGGNGREPEAGHGLRNMRDRARELGARIEIHSHPGGGTRVSLRCPLRSRYRMIMR